MTKTKLKKIEVKIFIGERLERVEVFPNCKDIIDAFIRSMTLFFRVYTGPTDEMSVEFKEVLG